MDGVAADCEAFGEAVVFLKYFSDMPGPRHYGKVAYPLDEILLLRLFAALAGADTFVDIARFGARKLDFLRRFAMGRRRTITSAISSQPSTPGSSNAASLPGSPH